MVSLFSRPVTALFQQDEAGEDEELRLLREQDRMAAGNAPSAGGPYRLFMAAPPPKLYPGMPSDPQERMKEIEQEMDSLRMKREGGDAEAQRLNEDLKRLEKGLLYSQPAYASDYGGSTREDMIRAQKEHDTQLQATRERVGQLQQERARGDKRYAELRQEQRGLQGVPEPAPMAPTQTPGAPAIRPPAPAPGESSELGSLEEAQKQTVQGLLYPPGVYPESMNKAVMGTLGVEGPQGAAIAHLTQHLNRDLTQDSIYQAAAREYAASRDKNPADLHTSLTSPEAILKLARLGVGPFSFDQVKDALGHLEGPEVALAWQRYQAEYELAKAKKEAPSMFSLPNILAFAMFALAGKPEAGAHLVMQIHQLRTGDVARAQHHLERTKEAQVGLAEKLGLEKARTDREQALWKQRLDAMMEMTKQRGAQAIDLENIKNTQREIANQHLSPGQELSALVRLRANTNDKLEFATGADKKAGQQLLQQLDRDIATLRQKAGRTPK